MRLEEATWALLQETLDVYRDDPRVSAHVHHQITRLNDPLRIAVMGQAKSGKSTLVNAILGEEIAPVFENVLTWYHDGPTPLITAYTVTGAAHDLPATRSAAGTRIDLAGWRADQIRDIVVQWPIRALRNASLVDTQPEAPPTSEVDAVLYLSRDVRAADLDALQQAHLSSVARAAPVSTILVLSRADEIGGGRIDALLTARQLARRHHRDPRVSSVSLGVVPVSGLVALASRVLSEEDFERLQGIAFMPRPELDGYLLSADRFAAAGGGELLERFGLHGVRLATTLVRTGHDTRAKLGAELARRSGLGELREALNQYFIERRDVLKARSALIVLEELLRNDSRPGAAELLARLERVIAGAHEFAELRLMATLRAAEVTFDDDLNAEAHRLIGGNGGSVAARLGLEHEASDAELWALCSEALIRWQGLAEDPGFGFELAQQRAARVVVRSCEGLLAELSEARRFGYAR
ncbi:GTPase domain-containing protein [Allorhizocola rhizosphaerae]|uniref:GTPase domain-containing protein n=1 Tax=Allorhizocola rhizosphaerae TaxID=1872709 RepID=UPI000E3EC70C|nr:GTPase domain-containing protein [Allorhizocola rhizosphaerae]